MPAFHQLRVAAIEPVAEDAVSLRFDVPPELAQAYAFRPGQHVAIRGEDEVRRSYSVCTTPASGELVVGVRRLPGGGFSGATLDRLRPGDVLDVMTPSGSFGATVRPGRPRRVVAVAGGSGITPILPILTSALAGEERSSATLVWANRTHGTAMFLDEVAGLKDRWPDRFQLVHVLSREEGASELLSGHLDADRTKRLLHDLVDVPDVDDWLLCGPEGLVSTVAQVLAEAGVPPDRVHRELFHTGAAPPPRRSAPPPTDAPGSEVTARLDGRSSRFRVDPATPVLEGMLGARADAPYACRGGVCGTCRARVLEGTVEMAQNWALEPDEVAAGYVLTCQSRVTSPSLVVDYDG